MVVFLFGQAAVGVPSVLTDQLATLKSSSAFTLLLRLVLLLGSIHVT
jgi:hypothetical protein